MINNKYLLNRQKEIRKKIDEFIEINTIHNEFVENTILSNSIDNNINITEFKIETINDFIYYQSLIDEYKEITEQLYLEYKNNEIIKNRINKINKIRKNEKC